MAKPLFTPKSFGLRKVPSVRTPRPSLKYGFRSKFLCWMCRLGCTPSWITRVKPTRRGLRQLAVKDQLQAVRAAQVEVVAHRLFKELPRPLRPVEDPGQIY